MGRKRKIIKFCTLSDKRANCTIITFSCFAWACWCPVNMGFFSHAWGSLKNTKIVFSQNKFWVINFFTCWQFCWFSLKNYCFFMGYSYYIFCHYVSFNHQGWFTTAFYSYRHGSVRGSWFLWLIFQTSYTISFFLGL